MPDTPLGVSAAGRVGVVGDRRAAAAVASVGGARLVFRWTLVWAAI